MPRIPSFRLAAACLGATIAVVLSGTLGCASPAPAAEAGRAEAADTTATDARFSVYDLGSTWRDQDGRARSLTSLRGHPQLVAMAYTHCSTSCPITVDEMKRIERALPGIGFVLVSLDPERDSTGRLAEYARLRDLDQARWTLLTGTSDDVRELAATLGVRYRRISPDELAHSNTLTLLDATGTPVYQGWGPESEIEIADHVRRLAR